ncbi:MAG TPA: hypothetical protein VH307_04020 [Streptosporangiaceae bacterium]|jgi:hypothetical protein|nr:hypothetical protein [Streptosporangiaceae bacterium]
MSEPWKELMAHAVRLALDNAASVLGETFTGPPMITAESCPPSGLVAGQKASAYHQAYCDSERLYAINA